MTPSVYPFPGEFSIPRKGVRGEQFLKGARIFIVIAIMADVIDMYCFSYGNNIGAL
jgi:hypothetical protein